MLKKFFKFAKKLIRSNIKILLAVVIIVAISMFVALGMGKIYQGWDKDPSRGATAIENGEFGEDYSTPIYLDQGWKKSDSLWFYNTTQGSALLPYDLFLVLEQSESEELFRSDANVDKYRYLPQHKTFFNPDALPVGFVKEPYQGKDYIGYTCAACHTAQVNYKGQAIRIDGGPAMSDMVGFLTALDESMQTTLKQEDKRKRFVNAVLELDNNYDNEEEVIADLKLWGDKITLYNTVNHTNVDYGYARLDAFGRIYNRVLEHVINRQQLKIILLNATDKEGTRLLSSDQVDLVLAGADETIIGSTEAAKILSRLTSTESGYPGLKLDDVLLIRNRIYNEPNAPVSYPFLWDIAQSDYVQWNGLASNASVGPIGRNAGEVIGVFGILDWTASDPDFSLAAKVSGQSKKTKKIDFKSSIDLTNLKRLESHLKSLKSPQWPEEILGKIDQDKAQRGELIYAQYCQSCHEIIVRDNWDRVVVGKMMAVDFVKTDPAMATNSVNYSGQTGNFAQTYQETDVGPVIMEQTAPVAQILTAATKGVVATPDADKWFIRRWLDLIYTFAMSLFDNDIEFSVKSGNYLPDTTAKPFNSLLAYKARSLNGIWATAPYLHNGSVPSLYDLLLPARREGDPDEGEYRPDSFRTGSREFDPVKVGMRTEGYDGFLYETNKRGNFNSGHEYGGGRTPQLNGRVLPALNEQQRWDLVEFMKTL